MGGAREKEPFSIGEGPVLKGQRFYKRAVWCALRSRGKIIILKQRRVYSTFYSWKQKYWLDYQTFDVWNSTVLQNKGTVSYEFRLLLDECYRHSFYILKVKSYSYSFNHGFFTNSPPICKAIIGQNFSAQVIKSAGKFPEGWRASSHLPINPICVLNSNHEDEDCLLKGPQVVLSLLYECTVCVVLQGGMIWFFSRILKTGTKVLSSRFLKVKLAKNNKV